MDGALQLDLEEEVQRALCRGDAKRAAIEAAAAVVMRRCRAHRLRHVVRERRVANAAARAGAPSPRRLRDRVHVAEVPEARASAPGSTARAARGQLVPRVAPTGGHGPAWASFVPPSSR